MANNQSERAIWWILPVNIINIDSESPTIYGFWVDIIDKYLLKIPFINSFFIYTEIDELGEEHFAYKLYPYSLNGSKTWIGMIWRMYLKFYRSKR